MRYLWALLLFIVIVFPSTSWAQEKLLVFSGDLRGEIKPCGCSEEGDMGGLPRKLSLLKDLRKQNNQVFYFELGNNFPEPSEQGKLKINLIQDSLNKLAPEVVLVGTNEWENGLQLLEDSIPYLLSNQNGSLPFLQSKKIPPHSNSGGKTNNDILVMGYLSPELIYQNPNKPPTVLPVEKTLLKKWGKIISENNKVYKILLFRGNLQELQMFHQSKLFDLIVSGSNNNDELNQVLQLKTASASLPMIPTKGQGVLLGKLTQTGKMIPVKNELVPAGLSIQWLRQNFADAPELNVTFKLYNKAVKEMFFSNIDRMDQQRKESPFVGNQQCLECHEDSSIKWEGSRHASAFATLEKVGKQFDPECLECHVVGLKAWKAPSDAVAEMIKFDGATGYISPQITPHLANVQCENCHGPAKLHLEDEEFLPPNNTAKTVCITCHQGSHSPSFVFEEYWQKIEH